MSGWIEAALGRTPTPLDIEAALDTIAERGTVLVTGALGSIGLALCDTLEAAGIEATSTDIDEMDVTDPRQVARVMAIFEPATIIHLAGAKHAPEGELDPMEPTRVHIDGTRNVLDYAPVGCRVVTASTCKACDPETAYGATKLIAERLTRNAGQTVARFHNVVDSAGNVFEAWADLDSDASIPVTDCWRYLISSSEAVSLLLCAAAGEPGRYQLDVCESRYMPDVARDLYPLRERVVIPRRRGDRAREPWKAWCEEALTGGGLARIVSPYDPVEVTA